MSLRAARRRAWSADHIDGIIFGSDPRFGHIRRVQIEQRVRGVLLLIIFAAFYVIEDDNPLETVMNFGEAVNGGASQLLTCSSCSAACGSWGAKVPAKSLPTLAAANEELDGAFNIGIAVSGNAASRKSTWDNGVAWTIRTKSANIVVGRTRRKLVSCPSRSLTTSLTPSYSLASSTADRQHTAPHNEGAAACGRLQPPEYDLPPCILKDALGGSVTASHLLESRAVPSRPCARRESSPPSFGQGHLGDRRIYTKPLRTHRIAAACSQGFGSRSAIVASSGSKKRQATSG